MQQNDLISLEQAIEEKPLAVSPETPLEEVIELMSRSWATSCVLAVGEPINRPKLPTQFRHSCVVAIANSEVVGILTERDVVNLISSGRSLRGIALAEVMHKDTIALTFTGLQDIFTALNLFRRYQIRHLPVVDRDRRLLGLVTHNSLRQVLRSTDLLKFRTVREVMSRAIHAVSTASILEVAQLMSDYQVSSIPIVETSDRDCLVPLGIITQKDIVQFQLLELNLSEVQAREVMSTPLFLAKPDDSLWEVLSR